MQVRLASGSKTVQGRNDTVAAYQCTQTRRLRVPGSIDTAVRMSLTRQTFVKVQSAGTALPSFHLLIEQTIFDFGFRIQLPKAIDLPFSNAGFRQLDVFQIGKLDRNLDQPIVRRLRARCQSKDYVVSGSIFIHNATQKSLRLRCKCRHARSKFPTPSRLVLRWMSSAETSNRLY